MENFRKKDILWIFEKVWGRIDKEHADNKYKDSKREIDNVPWN